MYSYDIFFQEILKAIDQMFDLVCLSKIKVGRMVISTKEKITDDKRFQTHLKHAI